MNVFVGVPAAAALIVPSHGSEDDDSLLISNASKIEALQIEIDELSPDLDRLFERYFDEKPSKPEVLLWRPWDGDMVGYELERLASGKVRCWCDPESIEKRREQPIMRREFVGTDEQWASEAGNDALWADVPDEKGQKRFDEILAAHDAHKAACEHFSDHLGLTDLGEKIDALEDEKQDLMAIATRTPARSLAGIQAKARILRAIRGGDLEVDAEGDLFKGLLHGIANDAAQMVHASA